MRDLCDVLNVTVAKCPPAHSTAAAAECSAATCEPCASYATVAAQLRSRTRCMLLYWIVAAVVCHIKAIVTTLSVYAEFW